jgi:hypothetical protein
MGTSGPHPIPPAEPVMGPRRTVYDVLSDAQNRMRQENNSAQFASEYKKLRVAAKKDK